MTFTYNPLQNQEIGLHQYPQYLDAGTDEKTREETAQTQRSTVDDG